MFHKHWHQRVNDISAHCCSAQGEPEAQLEQVCIYWRLLNVCKARCNGENHNNHQHLYGFSSIMMLAWGTNEWRRPLMCPLRNTVGACYVADILQAIRSHHSWLERIRQNIYKKKRWEGEWKRKKSNNQWQIDRFTEVISRIITIQSIPWVVITLGHWTMTFSTGYTWLSKLYTGIKQTVVLKPFLFKGTLQNLPGIS